ncbi:unnamed protein product [Cyprideis torosa]|uniref:Uncharacterized protein n=1 Tax=Cyprideis torosa TaxID=163714 RepID=A0A7R8W5L1_9CRUS|nr:unnamed protein product [Cyprideis torosa]CAG0884422.1 unnamed protein product [Cyprideis torosa]
MPKKKKGSGARAGMGITGAPTTSGPRYNPQPDKGTIPKNAPTPFGEFLKQFRKELRERRGGQAYEDENTIISMANARFKSLAPEDKAVYEKRAEVAKKKWKEQREKFTSEGRSLNEIEREARHRETMMVERNEAMHDLVSRPASLDKLANTTFVLISFEYFYCTEIDANTADIIYFPAEVGVQGFTLAQGLKPEVSYHTLIDPGPIRPGFLSAVKSRTEDVHQISHSQNPYLYDKYPDIIRQLQLVLRKADPIRFRQDETSFDRNPPPFFVRSDERDMVESILEWLWEQTPQTGTMRRLMPFKLDLAFCTDLMNLTKYDFYMCLWCFYHGNLPSEKETSNCALGKAKRNCVMFCEALCPIMDIPIVEGMQRPSVKDPPPPMKPVPIKSPSAGNQGKEDDPFDLGAGPGTGGASSLLSQRLDYHIIPAEELIVEHREEVIRNIKNKKKLKEQDYKPPPDPLFDAEGLGNNITLVTEDTAQFVQGAWGRGAPVRTGSTPWGQPAAGPYLASNLGTPSSAQEAPDLSNEDEFPAL